jgi:hypothetical protein
MGVGRFSQGGRRSAGSFLRREAAHFFEAFLRRFAPVCTTVGLRPSALSNLRGLSSLRRAYRLPAPVGHGAPCPYSAGPCEFLSFDISPLRTADGRPYIFCLPIPKKCPRGEHLGREGLVFPREGAFQGEVEKERVVFAQRQEVGDGCRAPDATG